MPFEEKPKVNTIQPEDRKEQTVNSAVSTDSDNLWSQPPHPIKPCRSPDLRHVIPTSHYWPYLHPRACRGFYVSSLPQIPL